MLWLAAAAIAITQPAPRVFAVAQATVTIRILTAATLKLDGSSNSNTPAAHSATVKAADGTRQPVKLIEFQ